jgi:hypothetical protein
VLELEFADGRLRALPEDPARRRPQRARREAAPAEQGRLL